MWKSQADRDKAYTTYKLRVIKMARRCSVEEIMFDFLEYLEHAGIRGNKGSECGGNLGCHPQGNGHNQDNDQKMTAMKSSNFPVLAFVLPPPSAAKRQ